MRIGALAVVVCVALALLGPGCRSESAGDAKQADPVVLNVGHVGHDHQIALYIAAMEGERLGKDHGVFLREVKPREVYDLVDDGRVVARLNLHKVGGGSKMPAAMEQGMIDIGLGGTPAICAFRDRGAPFKIIAPLQTDGDMLLVRPDVFADDWPSFLAMVRAADRPVTIGYKAPLAVAKMVFEGALEAEGITHSDRSAESVQVHLVNTRGPQAMLALLERGEVDGIVMNQPTVAVAESQGLGKTLCQLRDMTPAGHWVDHPCCSVAATEALLASHPEAVKALIKVIILGGRLIERDPERAIDVAAEWINTPRQIEASSVPTVTYVPTPTDSWRRGMAVWLGRMQQAEGFTGRFQTMDADAFLADVCDFALCEQAKAELASAERTAAN